MVKLHEILLGIDRYQKRKKHYELNYCFSNVRDLFAKQGKHY